MYSVPRYLPGGARICKGGRELWQGFPASAASDENVGMNRPQSRDCHHRTAIPM